MNLVGKAEAGIKLRVIRRSGVSIAGVYPRFYGNRSERKREGINDETTALLGEAHTHARVNARVCRSGDTVGARRCRASSVTESESAKHRHHRCHALLAKPWSVSVSVTSRASSHQDNPSLGQRLLGPVSRGIFSDSK